MCAASSDVCVLLCLLVYTMRAVLLAAALVHAACLVLLRGQVHLIVFDLLFDTCTYGVLRQALCTMTAKYDIIKKQAASYETCTLPKARIVRSLPCINWNVCIISAFYLQDNTCRS